MKKAIFGGVAATLIIFLGTWSVGRLSNGEALQLFQSIQPTVRFMSSAVMTATATILALILTLLSFTGGHDGKFSAGFYQHIKWIARLTTYTFIAALALLMFLSIPIIESDSEITSYYTVIYYASQIYAAAVGGALITITLSLYEAAKDVILVMHPERDADDLLVSEDTREKEG